MSNCTATIPCSVDCCPQTNWGKILGPVFSALVVLSVCGGLAGWWYRKRRQRTNGPPHPIGTGDPTTGHHSSAAGCRSHPVSQNPYENIRMGMPEEPKTGLGHEQLSGSLSSEGEYLSYNAPDEEEDSVYVNYTGAGY
ncbi:hypothetical protein DPEC_G00320820 [Dallia pectoralis]|uniref:Uncharacterized protein n=1 Tax=Dallia pectoralis TaxID=75939 RepID=A0ACC2FA21_DALPE|nr:hypothetical protein DPEC_G00320820 [Dallia pectoralis]